jgi:hypothetical protein
VVESLSNDWSSSSSIDEAMSGNSPRKLPSQYHRPNGRLAAVCHRGGVLTSPRPTSLAGGISPPWALMYISTCDAGKAVERARVSGSSCSWWWRTITAWACSAVRSAGPPDASSFRPTRPVTIFTVSASIFSSRTLEPAPK